MAGPARVLQLLWSLDIGGAEKFVMNFVRHLDRSRYAPSICVLDADGPLRTEAESLGVPVFRLRRGPVPVLIARLLNVVRRWQPDLIHAHSLAPGFYGALAGALSRTPVLTTRHGRPEESAEKSIVRTLSYRFTDRFIAVSDQVRQLLIDVSAAPAERFYTVLNGIDTAHFADARDAGLRAELGIPESSFTFGTVGRLGVSKAQHIMIDAMKSLTDRGEDAFLVIAGDGPLRQELEQQVSELRLESHVRMLGNWHNVASLLKCLDAFVLSSIDEGVPLSLLEAMAAGLPSVVTHIGGIPEVVTDGTHGLMVPVKDTQAFAAAMERLMSEPELRTRLGKAASELVRARFDIEHMMREYYRHYDAVLCRRGKSPSHPHTTFSLPAPGRLARYAFATANVLSDANLDSPTLVLESDDWAQSAMPDREVYEELIHVGAVSRGNPWATDALETVEDIDALCDVLRRYPDSQGRPLPITANFIVSNPEFAVLESTNGKDLPFIALDADAENNPVSRVLTEAWRTAAAAGFIVPEYHGLWHIAPEALRALWQAGNRTVRECVRRGARPPGLTSSEGTAMLSEYLFQNGTAAALRPRPFEEQRKTIREGIAIFESVFGHGPRSTVPPHYLWDATTERVWREVGIRSVQAANRRLDARSALGFLCAPRIATGRRSPAGLIYLTRNCRFEPAVYDDNAHTVFRSIRTAFETKRAAIVGCHRINFSGKIAPQQRTKTLGELGKLLNRVRQEYPNVRFMSSAELASIFAGHAKDGTLLPSRALVKRLSYLGARVGGLQH